MGRKEKEVLEVKMKERLHSMKGTRNTRIAKKEEGSKSLEIQEEQEQLVGSVRISNN